VIALNYAEFYITNVCNLNCPDCNRFNNFNFKGHTRWNDYFEQNKKWSQVLDIGTIGILGGEPMLNPDFLLWVEGLAQLWPSSAIKIATNGTQLKRWPQLYDVLVKYQGRVTVEISGHDADTQHDLERCVDEFLDGRDNFTSTAWQYKTSHRRWQLSYQQIRDPAWPECDTPGDFYSLPAAIQRECIDIHGFSPETYDYLGTQDPDRKRVIEIYLYDNFVNSAVKYDPVTHSLSLNQSDPNKAMEVCSFRVCHHIIKGKLYKCGPVGILPEFVEQFDVSMTDRQRYLIESYRPAEPDWDGDELESFAKNLRDGVPIPQCSLCPEELVLNRFKATSKKIKFYKKINMDDPA